MSTTSITYKLKKSLSKRDPLRKEGTNAFRLVNGVGDGLPEIYLDDFAGKWLLSTKTNAIPTELKTWLIEQNHPVYWKKLSQNERKSPTHLAGPTVNAPFYITENGLKYKISLKSGYSQGLFIDQRENRLKVQKLCKPEQRILNTFAYTGAFSVSAASTGAITTTLDLSQTYLDWARENFQANEILPAQQFFCKGDTFHWLARFAKQGRRFHGIILDPPTFSRDQKGKTFRLADHYGKLVSLAEALLEPKGWLLCCANTHHVFPRTFQKMVEESLTTPAKITNSPMPPDFPSADYLKTLWVEKTL